MADVFYYENNWRKATNPIVAKLQDTDKIPQTSLDHYSSGSRPRGYNGPTFMFTDVTVVSRTYVENSKMNGAVLALMPDVRTGKQYLIIGETGGHKATLPQPSLATHADGGRLS